MKKFLLIIGLLLLLLPGRSQENPVKFEHLTAKDGLSQGHVLCMIQDSEGYIWAGTYLGLNRFNGYSFDVFYADNNSPYSLFIDVVFSLYEDSRGNIWCGTWGVDVFDRESETFRHYPAFVGEYPISAGEVSAITEDTSGYMWLATQGGGLNRLDPLTNEMVYYTADGDAKHRLLSNYINDILIDRRQRLWVATEDGGLSRIDLTSDSIVHYTADHNQMLSLISNKISCLFEDSHGKIWIGDHSGHLLAYQEDSDNFISHSFVPKGFNLKRARIMQIAEDLNGNLLLATNGSGLIVYDPVKQESKVYQHDTFQEYSIASNETYSILVDNANTVFVGTFGRGISKFSPFSRKFDAYAIQESSGIKGDVNSFTDAIEDSRGNLITGTYNGFFVFDQNTWEYQHILPGSSYEENKILTLALAPDSTIWISSMRSLHRYDRNYRKLHSYIFTDTLKDHSIYALEFDKNNDLWIGLFTKGTLRISEQIWRDRKRKDLPAELFLLDYNDSTSISGNQIWNIDQDPLGNLYFGGVGGFDRFNYSTRNFTRLCYPGMVKTFDFDQNGNIWLGTIGAGLFSFQETTGRLKKYTTADGLPHSFIYSVVADTLNNLWISSETGLSRFDIENEEFRNFDERDGLPDDHFDDKAESKISDGRIYMGTNKGFIIFRPEEIHDDMHHGKVVLTDLHINNRQVKYLPRRNQDSISMVPVNRITKIRLGPSERDISFKFAALHYAAPYKIEYKYMLEGYDEDWILTNAENRSVKYTNLDAGEYLFKVIATNSDGQWSDDPLMISIVATPPLYKRLWFRIAMVGVLLLLITLGFRLRLKREVRQREVLARLVDERTAEITNKSKLLERIAEDLRETNALLEERQQYIEEQSEELTTQRDELALTNATKDKLFSVIAHDLKNPFNVILGYCELLIIRNEEWDNEKKLYFLTMLKEASEGAYALLENLLQWSRSQSGTIRYNPVPTKINDLIEEVTSEVENFARKKNIKLVARKSKEDFEVSVDINMATTVMRNLISNAIKFSDSGEKILIDIEKHSQGFIRVSVKDEGVGIEPDELEGLFKLEQGKSNTGTEGEKGTGIGLILCKEFIDHHGGEIWAENNEDKGSTFRFTIPLK